MPAADVNVARPTRRARARYRAVVPCLVVVVGALVGACKSPAGESSSPGNTTAAKAGTADITIAAAGQPKRGGHLVYGVEAETDSLNPTKARWAIAGLMYANTVFDPLAAYDKDGVPQPYLAKEFKHSPDYKTWTITFREGITFHNGTKLDADAGITFINKLKESPLTGPAARPIAKITKISELSADLQMDVPWVAFPHIMTGQGGLIPAPEQLNDPGEAGSSKPIGTGPFKFKEWVRDNHFTVDRNPTYWRKDASGQPLPYLDSVEFRPITDTKSRADSLVSGNVTIIHDDHAQTVQTLEEQARDGKLQFIKGGGEDEESFVMFNTKAAPLDDVRVRQALAYATNIEDYMNVTQEDASLAADSPFSKDGQWYVDPGFPKYDLAKAKQLIDAYKAERGVQEVAFTLATTPSPENQASVQELKRQWEQAGVKVTITTNEQVQFILGAVTGRFQANLWRQFSALDPDGDFHFWIGRNARDDNEFRLNFANNVDAETDKALDDGRSNPDPAARKAAYATLAKRFAERVPYLWLQHVRWSIAAQNRVRGILNGPLPDGQESLPVQAGVHRLTQTWLDS